MKGQRNVDVSGTSRLSLADVGLGAAAGFLVPVVTNRVLELYGSSSTFLSDSSNRQMVSAAMGIVVAIPVYFWRGMAPAIVAAAIALVYGVGGYVSDWVNQIGTSTPAALGRGGRPVGLLQQATPQRQLGRIQQAGRGRRFEFAGTAD